MHEHAVPVNRKKLQPKPQETWHQSSGHHERWKSGEADFHSMDVKLETDNERERKKANMVYQMAEKICPLRQSWGEDVPISFELNFQ